MKKLLFLVAALWLSISSASAQTLIRSGTGSPVYDKDPVFKAIAETKDVIAKSSATPEQVAALTSSLAHIEMLVTRGFPLDQLLTMVSRLLTISADPKIVTAVDALTQKFQTMHQEAQIKAGKEIHEEQAKLNAAVDQALKAALSAKDGQEVSPLISDLRSQQSLIGSRSFNQPNRLQTALRFLGDWQSFLTTEQLGNTVEAINMLGNMARNYSSGLEPVITPEILNARRQELANVYSQKTTEAVERLSKQLFSTTTPAAARSVEKELSTLKNQISLRTQMQGLRSEPELTAKLTSLTESAQRWASYIEQRERNEWRDALSNLDSIVRSGKSDEALSKILEKERANLFKTAATAADAYLKQLQEKLPKMQAGNTSERQDFSRFKSLLSQTEGHDDLLLRIAEAEVVLPAWMDVLQAELRGDGDSMASSLVRVARVKKIEQPLIPAALIAEKKEVASKMTGRSVDPVAAAELPTEEALNKRISEIKTPDQLNALGKELAGLSARPNGATDYALQALASELENLRAFWSGANAGAVSRNLMSLGGGSRGWCREAIDALRNRIVVQSAATTLSLPHLAEPPLANKPLTESLNSLAAEFAAKGDWRKTYDILQFLDSGLASTWGPAGAQQRTRGIASYLAGLNFESAEQWPQAVQSYHDVLRSVTGLNPTKEAAERLKALRREHPEAFVPAAAAGSPIVSPQGHAQPAPQRGL